MSIDVESFISRIAAFTSAAHLTAIPVDLEFADFHLRGRLASITEAGFVHIRYARQRAKDLLNSWIYHLVFCLAAPPDCRLNSYLLCRDSAVQFDRVPECRSILQDLLALFQRGLKQPIHFFPESSYVYAEQLLKKGTFEQAALNKAGRKWHGSEFAKSARGESEDLYYDLCFRRSEPLDDAFTEIAVTVYEPLLAHCREIVI